MVEQSYQNNCGLASPDTNPTAAHDVYEGLGETTSQGNTPSIRDYRGTIPMCDIVSKPNLGGKDDISPMSNIFDILHNRKTTHVCWVTTAPVTGLEYPDILAAIAADGGASGLHTVCPTQYSSCDVGGT